MLIALYKPYGVLSQFTPDQPGQRTMAECGLPAKVYPIGRLDQDSEGLILLTDEPALVAPLLEPRRGHPREYHVQVEGTPTPEAISRLAKGVMIQGRLTLPAQAKALTEQGESAWPPREPPVRFRKTVPDAWLAIQLIEGRNRQVRRMTAAVGLPTLRLIRVRIGQLTLPSLGLLPGRWCELSPEQRLLAMGSEPKVRF
jgi:23S rRNA pseudouridine2457 synthase